MYAKINYNPTLYYESEVKKIVYRLYIFHLIYSGIAFQECFRGSQQRICDTDCTIYIYI